MVVEERVWGEVELPDGVHTYGRNIMIGFE